MIPRVEHIGQVSSASWPKRARRWLGDLFGSKYAQHLERELLQVRLDKDRLIETLRAERDSLLQALMATKGIPLRMPIPVAASEANKPAAIPTTNWQRLQAEAIQENARQEAEDAKNAAQGVQAKEN